MRTSLHDFILRPATSRNGDRPAVAASGSASASTGRDPSGPTLGATVTGLKLAELDDETFAELHECWLEHALLIFPSQHLTHDEQIAFAKRFGDLEFDLAPISNVRKDGSLRTDETEDDVVKILKGNMGWHHDSTYMPVQAKGACLHGSRGSIERR